MTEWRGFASQKKQLCDDKGNLLVKMVFKMENLVADWPKICKRLNINYMPLEHLNISNYKQNNYGKFYHDKADIIFIQKLFQNDFEFFSYPNKIK